MNKGWLVNDCLTCIPETKTFWHDLLENINGLQDKTFGYTPFNKLARKIEWELFIHKKPDYIIRNATFFRPIKTKVPQICLLQDYYDEEKFLKEQLPVINSCHTTVINSYYIYDKVKKYLDGQNLEIIPMGVDFDFFNPNLKIEQDTEVLPDSILFTGAATNWPKGFDLLMEIVENTDYNFTFVMKDDFKINHPRIKVFNKINQTKLKSIMKKCRMAICTSRMETFHLAGVEACAMNLPVAATEVGIYTHLEDGGWGLKFNKDNVYEKISYIFNHTDEFSPRKTLLDLKLDKKNCMEKWNNLVDKVITSNSINKIRK